MTEDGPLPEGWRYVTLGEITTGAANTDPRSRPNEEFVYVDISSVDRLTKLIASPKDILGTDAPSRARRLIRADDVIVSTTRPNLNAVAHIDRSLDGAICSTGFCVLRPGDQCHPAYIFRLVQSVGFVDSMTAKMTGASYPAVTNKVVRAFKFALPPLEEQRRIAGLMNAAERVRAAAAAQVAAAEGLMTTLLRQSFGAAA